MNTSQISQSPPPVSRVAPSVTSPRTGQRQPTAGGVALPTRIANGGAPPEPKVDYPLGRSVYSPTGIGQITRICNDRGLGLVDLTQGRFQRQAPADASSLRTPAPDYPGGVPKPDYLSVRFHAPDPADA